MSASVIHHIKGNRYLYSHYRVGDRVVAEYIGALGSDGNIRASKHGGGRRATVKEEVIKELTDIVMTESNTAKIDSASEKLGIKKTVNQ